MRRLMFALMIIAVFTAVLSASLNESNSCIPWKGKCQAYEDCCRYLICPTYEARCILKPGLIVPGEDTRPIGEGPFPPDYPKI